MTDLDRIAGAIVIAGALIALALFSRPTPLQIGRYEFSMSGSVIRRFDTLTGSALVCNRERCMEVDEDGRREFYDPREPFR